jgi:hypothetical protein
MGELHPIDTTSPENTASRKHSVPKHSVPKTQRPQNTASPKHSVPRKESPVRAVASRVSVDDLDEESR